MRAQSTTHGPDVEKRRAHIEFRWGDRAYRLVYEQAFVFAYTLFEQGHISYEEALRWASNVDEFKLKVQGISTTADMARDQMARAGHGGSPEITRFGG